MLIIQTHHYHSVTTVFLLFQPNLHMVCSWANSTQSGIHVCSMFWHQPNFFQHRIFPTRLLGLTFVETNCFTICNCTPSISIVLSTPATWPNIWHCIKPHSAKHMTLRYDVWLQAFVVAVGFTVLDMCQHTTCNSHSICQHTYCTSYSIVNTHCNNYSIWQYTYCSSYGICQSMIGSSSCQVHAHDHICSDISNLMFQQMITYASKLYFLCSDICIRSYFCKKLHILTK